MKVDYPEEQKAALAANAMAKKMFAQADNASNLQVLFEAIVNHRADESHVKQQETLIATFT